MMLNTAVTKQPRKEEHEQFYTSKELGRLLLSQIPQKWLKLQQVNALDLCMGQAALLECVSEISPTASLFGTDIDLSNIEIVNMKNKIAVQTHCIDATTPGISLICRNKGFNLIVGNPPFKIIKNNNFIKNELLNFGYNISSEYIEAELYFLVYGLNLLTNGGYLAYILPDGIFTKISLMKFRRFLSFNFSIEAIFEIEPGSFRGTEAKTHLLLIKKSLPTKDNILLHKVDSKTQSISISDFINRGDYSFYSKACAIKMETLSSLNVEIIRGRYTKKYLTENNIENYIHTNKISHSGTKLTSKSQVSLNKKAKKGDIVIARVGTRCIGKFGVIESGEFYVSDCIFIIRSKTKNHRDAIIKTLKSSFGRNWLDSASKGVGARHITTSDLYNLPVIVGENENT